MKRTLEDHAARFDEKAGEYDDSKSEEYHACANLVVEHAAPAADEVVLDLATGTGAIALAVAPDAARVVGRDISDGMLEEAREKAADAGLENVEFGQGTFREPDYDGPVDVVTSNFALHHLSDEEKREAIAVIADLEPRRFVLGDVMFFGEPDPDEPFYSPEVDDPATVGVLADAFTDAGFSLTAVERVHDQVGVLVAERSPTAGVDAATEES
ncbi:class I SAM-dependent methyltransferase [Natrinema thermotolerans]|uniref:Class I SAM-dependent methyltransferase n=1 Tax=Natrinema thermotolerans TaxID=121872 RepID=A0AAF0T1Y9_9EURY|nr:class I SAM-dependent methyltransferase [Natrinema thermotolerans]QCC57577.1 class I SAM-dependent methyltransferase [Natrinema thermotolerans]WMT08655.1 class I SAM-dependent methyltransferase [Natrinema thermotolerans]